jgi:hypothetical protein
MKFLVASLVFPLAIAALSLDQAQIPLGGSSVSSSPAPAAPVPQVAPDIQGLQPFILPPIAVPVPVVEEKKEKPQEKSQSLWSLLWSSLPKPQTANGHSCFCSGVTLCCHTGRGMSCDFGICGI